MKAGKNWLGKVDVGFHIGFEKLENSRSGACGLSAEGLKKSLKREPGLMPGVAGPRRSCRKREDRERSGHWGAGKGFAGAVQGGTVGLRRETA